MVKVKPAALWKKRYEEAIPTIPSRYADGAQAATDVIARMIKGQANYEAKMSDPEVLKRREEKLRELTDDDWKKMVKEKGVKRIGDGMRIGKPKYDAAAEKSASILESLVLPERTTDVDQNIANRVCGVVHDLRKGWGKE